LSYYDYSALPNERGGLKAVKRVHFLTMVEVYRQGVWEILKAARMKGIIFAIQLIFFPKKNKLEICDYLCLMGLYKNSTLLF
jgi:hypothetical protein